MAFALVLCCAMVCGAGVFVWRDAARMRAAERDLTRQGDDARAAIEARRVTVEEKRLALEEKRYAEVPRPVPMPPDLAARPLMWEDGFAQEQERATIVALYAEFGDWDLVRRHLAPLTPVFGSEIVAPRDVS